MINVQIRALQPGHLIEIIKVRQTNWTLTQLIRKLMLLHITLVRSFRIFDLRTVPKEALKCTCKCLLILLILELFLSLLSLPPQVLLLSGQRGLENHLEITWLLGLALLHLGKALDILIMSLA